MILWNIIFLNNSLFYWTNNFIERTILLNEQFYWTNNFIERTILLNKKFYWTIVKHGKWTINEIFFLNDWNKKQRKWVVHKRSTNEMWNCEFWYTLKFLFLEKFFFAVQHLIARDSTHYTKFVENLLKKCCYFFESNYFCLRNLSAKVIVFYDTSKTKIFIFSKLK